MKISRTLQIAATLILGLGPVTGHAQTYFYSGPVSGWTEVDLSPQGLGAGGFIATFGTLTETLYYDPVALTLREVGSVTVNPSSGSFDIRGYINWPPVETGSATLTVGNNGSVSFDRMTGWRGGPSSSDPLVVPISGSGVLDGQAFAGSWNLDIDVSTKFIAASPTSLTFREADVSGSQQAGTRGYVIPGTDLVDAVDDGTYYYSWHLDSVVAAVPEHNSISLLVLGLSALAFLRRC